MILLDIMVGQGENPQCIAGCISYHGGEKKHHKDCPYYKDSLSRKNDELEELVKDLLLFTEENGEVVNGFRTREILLNLKKKVS